MLRYLLFSTLIFMQVGCVSNVLTGANFIYDRHRFYLKLNDFQLGASVNRVLYRDRRFEHEGTIEVAVFKRDILLAGRLSKASLREEAYRRVAALPGYRRIFNQIEISAEPINDVSDGFITTKIRSQILADSDIDPSQFKIVTFGQIVYIMGDVVPEQAKKVVQFARETMGVRRVVRLMKYYKLSDKMT